MCVELIIPTIGKMNVAKNTMMNLVTLYVVKDKYLGIYVGSNTIGSNTILG